LSLSASRKDRDRGVAFALAGALLAMAGCFHADRHTAVDVAMASAYRPPAVEGTGFLPRPLEGTDEGARFSLLAGDFHCHVSPPDWDQEANRDVAGTVALAKAEHLDFVVLTPHVGARFFLNDAYREAEVADLRALRATIAAQADGGPLLIPGFEYTDHEQGHLGFAFADLDAVLARLSVEQLEDRPQDFVSAWVAAGGLVVVNHPLVTPLDSWFAIGRANLSWRPWTANDGAFIPLEIAAANRLAHGFEAYNLTAAHLRDRYLSHTGRGTYQDTLARLDREIVNQQRRLVPIGGSDSHEDHLRATTFVLAEARTAAGIRDAVLAGRVCVRDPRACSLRARAAGRPWQPLGAAFAHASTIDVTAQGEAIAVLINGQVAAHPRKGEIASLSLDPSRCSVIRAEIDGGATAPLYANCAFAPPTPR
jgi:hypothetical protein